MKRGDYVAMLLAGLGMCGGAQAAYTVTVSQVGPNVVANGSGTIDMTGLVNGGIAVMPAQIRPVDARLRTGGVGPVNGYSGVVGPASFGTGFSAFPTTSSNDPVEIYGQTGIVAVPAGYIAGSLLNSTSTWNATTIAGLGLTPGTYTWVWAGDSFTVNILAPTAAASIPTLSEWGLIGMSVLLSMFGIAYTRRRR